MRVVLGLLVLGLLLWPARSVMEGDRAAEAATPASGDFAAPVAIEGGRRLYLECHGAGGPLVLLDSGLRTRGDVWNLTEAGPSPDAVFPSVAAFTRVCEYDRPGTVLGPGVVSRSDPVPMPRTTADAVADLHALVAAAALPGPYVLVGHSTGGLIGRLYASTYPAEVAGLVQVDAISEAVQRALTKKQFSLYDRLYLVRRAPELRGYADLETIDFRRSFRQMRRVAKPPRVFLHR